MEPTTAIVENDPVVVVVGPSLNFQKNYRHPYRCSRRMNGAGKIIIFQMVVMVVLLLTSMPQLPSAVAAVAAAADGAAADTEKKDAAVDYSDFWGVETGKEVTILGLGKMGRAMLFCYLHHGYTVHVWNRTPQYDLMVNIQTIEGLEIYMTPEEAISATATTLVVITDPKPDLSTVQEIVQANEAVFAGKTLVNFANHEPFAARELEKVTAAVPGLVHVSGNIFGTADTLCRDSTTILISSTSDAALHHPVFDHFSHVERFKGGDVGTASLVYACLIQTLYFGLAGFELSLLILEKYLPALTAETKHAFVNLAKTVVANHAADFFSVVAAAVEERNFDGMYAPAAAAADLFEMHGTMLRRLGIVSDIYSTTYQRYLRKTVEADGTAVGVTAVVQQYSTDGFQLETKNGTGTADTDPVKIDQELLKEVLTRYRVPPKEQLYQQQEQMDDEEEEEGGEGEEPNDEL